VSPDLERLVPTLVQGGVEFIVIGGVAAIIHGSARATYDVDLLYSCNEANIQRLANLLASYTPYLCAATPDLPFVWDVKTIRNGLDFTLTTDLGDIDSLATLLTGKLIRRSYRIRSTSKLSVSVSNVSIFRRSFASRKQQTDPKIAKHSLNCECYWKKARRSKSRRTPVFSAM